MGSGPSREQEEEEEYEEVVPNPISDHRLLIILHYNFSRGALSEREIGRVKDVILGSFPNAEMISRDNGRGVKLMVELQEVNDMKALEKECFGCSIIQFGSYIKMEKRHEAERLLIENIKMAIDHTEKQAENSILHALLAGELEGNH